MPTTASGEATPSVAKTIGEWRMARAKRADAKGNGDGLARKPENGGRCETHIAVVFKAQEHGVSVEEWKRRRPCPCLRVFGHSQLSFQFRT